MLSWFSDNLGKVVFLIGVVFLVVSLSIYNGFGFMFFAVSCFLGIVFTVFGLLSQLGFFSVSLRSFSGVGTILICMAVIFVASSVALFGFLEVTSSRVVAEIFKGAILGWKVILSTERPYLWLSALLIRLGFAFFGFGVLFKILHAVGL